MAKLLPRSGSLGRALAPGLALGLTFGLTGCGPSGPSTSAEVCSSYRDLAEELGKVNGFFDNGVFNRAGDLGDVAERYEDDAAVVADGKALKAIADGDSTSTGDLEQASFAIANLCGEAALSVLSSKIALGIDG